MTDLEADEHRALLLDYEAVRDERDRARAEVDRLKNDQQKSRKSGLTTLQLHALDRAVRTIVPTDWATYLVGTAQTGGTYRDVDVRTILADDEFDAVFGSRPDLWEAWCFAVGSWLARATGLPIDYQVQRRTEANEKYKGSRNPVGRGRSLRQYAGGGDATRFITAPEDDA